MTIEIIPQDSTEEIHKDEIKLYGNIEIKSLIEYYKVISDLQRGTQEKESNLTIIDLLPVEGIIEKEDIKIILEKIFKTKNQNKIIKQINKVYKQSISLLDNYISLVLQDDYKEKTWKSVDEFIEFTYNAANKKNKGSRKILDCVMVKTMYAVNDIIDNPKIAQVEADLKITVEKFKSIEGLKITGENGKGFNFVYNKPIGSKNKGPDHLKGFFVFRAKQFEKIFLKLIYNRKYDNIELLNDLVGFYLEVEDGDEEDATKFLLANMFDNDYKLDSKGGMLSEEFVKENKIKTRGQGSKQATGDSFQNISIIGEIPHKKNLSKKTQKIEAQIVKVNNKNESGFNHHDIYDMKKFLSACSRLFGFITIEEIKFAIQEIGIYSGLPEKKIIEHLFFPSESKAWKGENTSFLIPLMFDDDMFFVTSDTYNPDIQKIFKNYPDINTDGMIKENIYKKFIEKYEEIDYRKKYRQKNKKTT